ncbi:hypothetical protein EDB84DRAFT_1503373, partial [Lactarius hengduanensis]
IWESLSSTPLSTPLGNDLSSFISRRSLPHSDLQFSSLPSRPHLVEQDVVCFTKDGLRGVCVFTRRQTSEQGHRGFRLSSLSVLLAHSLRPRPWRHELEFDMDDGGVKDGSEVRGESQRLKRAFQLTHSL